MLALLVGSLMLVSARPAHASATFTVTSAADFADAQIGDGVCKAAFAFQHICTLRVAMQEANFTKAADTIEFDIPGNAVKTILPQTNLPSLGNPVTIDGFTQPGDVDVGPNGLQNFPVLTSARTISDETIISGTLNSAPNEGETLIGETFVSTDGSGDASFEFSPATAVPVGRAVTATATNASTLDTSEFAAPTTVKDGKPPSVTKVSPAEKATGVSPKANVSAFFSEAMDPSTINASSVKLRKVAATISYDPANKKAILNPRANLIHGAAYTVTVSTGVKDEAGNLLDQDPSLAGNQSKVWRFKVRN